eukprot:GHRQ01027881.1.p4 GENE.GHRQ01027881.1~~GHRQ01027881.1.p4  ORF type:complete len:100 (-),score=29.41 GHRQ01027881.1:850-1149(-)
MLDLLLRADRSVCFSGCSSAIVPGGVPAWLLSCVAWPLCMQDFRLSELVAKDGCAAVVVVNKWDMVAPKAAEDMDAYKADVKAQLRAVGWAPVVCTTAR